MLGHDIDLGVHREFGRSFSWSSVLRNDPCAYCGRPGETVDHIAPKGRGGKSSPSQNGTGSCYRCNTLKDCEPLLLFLLDFNHDKKRPWPRSTTYTPANGHSFFSQDQVEAMRRAVA